MKSNIVERFVKSRLSFRNNEVLVGPVDLTSSKKPLLSSQNAWHPRQDQNLRQLLRRPIRVV